MPAPSRDEAWELFQEWTESESLRRHVLGVEAAMRAYAGRKMKQPSFASAVSREDMRLGAEELGEDFDEHIAFVIAALEPRAEELGLSGQATAAGEA